MSLDLRNVAIVGHNGTGKTALLERMLFSAKVISRAELIESGKSVSDYTEEEISKKISIHSSLAYLKHFDKTINIFDTPGTAAFIGEVIAAFRASDSAIMCIDSVAAVQIETIKLWRNLNLRNKPRMCFVNKMDKERANFENIFNALKEQFEMSFVPISIPFYQGEDHKGTINLIENKAYILDDKGFEVAIDIPEELKEEANKYRDIMIEASAEGLDELIEKYFDEGTLSQEDIRRGLREGLKTNKVVPVFSGSTLKGTGILALLNFIANNCPGPDELTEKAIKDNQERFFIPINPDAQPSAYVIKTTIDQFSGKLSFLKVVTGSINADTELCNIHSKKKEKVGKIYRAIGKKLVEIPSATAGDIVIIAKSNAATNDSLLSSFDLDWKYMPLRLPVPVYRLAYETDDKKSEIKLNEALHKICEEDLTFQTKFDDETKESIIAGMGELHLNIILEKVCSKQKITVKTKLPKIAYRETILKKSPIVEYSHKKQSGGHGQFGRVILEIEPLKRGEFYSFTNAIKGGAISKNYMPGIEKGLHEAMSEGILAGYPIVDIGITVVDGKEHPVDSSEMAFKLAAKGAFKMAFEKASPVLLEPVVKLSVYANDEYTGEILSDLSSKRGKIQGQEELNGITITKALVPEKELLNYVIDLKSITSGTGSFELEFDHYETLSGKGADDIIAEYKASKEV